MLVDIVFYYSKSQLSSLGYPSEKIDVFSAEKYGITWHKLALFSADF
jgi:hypothetical protein